MNTSLAPEELDRLARKRGSAKLGWYAHASLYLVINLAVPALSKYGFGSRPWSAFPLLGWGLDLALHGISVFVPGTGSGLRERMVQQERETLQRQQDGTPR